MEALRAAAKDRSIARFQAECAGVADIIGNFQRGDAVTVTSTNGKEIGRGLCAYSSDDARRIMGHKTSEIKKLLGYRGRDEMIHRDDLVIT